MPRQLSQPALTAMLAQSTTKIFIATLKITGIGIPAPIFIVSDNMPVTISGDVYEPFPFDVVLPTDDADKPPVARLRVCNVSQLLVDELRTLPDPPNFELAIRLSDTPTVIEYGPWSLDATSVSYTIDEIEIDLRMRDFTVEPFPHIRYTPSHYPGIFKR